MIVLKNWINFKDASTTLKEKAQLLQRRITNKFTLPQLQHQLCMGYHIKMEHPLTNFGFH